MDSVMQYYCTPVEIWNLKMCMNAFFSCLIISSFENVYTRMIVCNTRPKRDKNVNMQTVI